MDVRAFCDEQFRSFGMTIQGSQVQCRSVFVVTFGIDVRPSAEESDYGLGIAEFCCV